MLMSEPVAWMREDGVIAFHKQKEVDSQGYKWQPLYTHPAELTDEEILKMAANMFHYSEYRLVIDFARAIL
jgi:nitrate reductase gamma subunit